MYGQSCRVVGRRRMGPLRFGGASLCWGRSETFHSHRSVGIPQVRWVHLARQYIALPRPWLPLRMESSVSRDLRSHVPQMWGSSGLSFLAWVVWGGGVVGGEEGVVAVHHPVASWCVVVGGGEGVVQIVHEGHVRGGNWLPVVGVGDVPRDVVPAVAQAGHPGYQCFSLPLFGVAGGGAGGGVAHVGPAVAGAALGVLPLRHGLSDYVSPPVDGGHPHSVPRGGRALAVSGGKWEAVVLGDVEEGVEEEVSDAFPEGGRLDQGGRSDALGGARGVEAQHPLVPESREVLPYRCGLVQGVGWGRCGGWWCGV